MRILLALGGTAACLIVTVLAGCSSVTTTLRYGSDGQPEYFIDCSGKPLGRCYEAALDTCPLGYYLVKEGQTPAGATGGSIWGNLIRLGAATNSTDVKFQNHVVVRCKAAAPAAPARRG